MVRAPPDATFGCTSPIPPSFPREHSSIPRNPPPPWYGGGCALSGAMIGGQKVRRYCPDGCFGWGWYAERGRVGLGPIVVGVGNGLRVEAVDGALQPPWTCRCNLLPCLQLKDLGQVRRLGVGVWAWEQWGVDGPRRRVGAGGRPRSETGLTVLGRPVVRLWRPSAHQREVVFEISASQYGVFVVQECVNQNRCSAHHVPPHNVHTNHTSSTTTTPTPMAAAMLS